MGSIREDRTRRIKGFIAGYLCEAGLITLEQLDTALERQLELIAQGRPLRLGEVLIEIGAITREQLDQVQKRDAMDGEEARPTQRDEER